MQLYNMQSGRGERVLQPNFDASLPEYLRNDSQEYGRARVYGFLRCYDCDGDVPLEQADSLMCRKLHNTVSRLFNRGWSDRDIVSECKRIFGNDVLYKQYVPPPPMINYKVLAICWILYLFRLRFVRVRWESRIRYRSDPR